MQCSRCRKKVIISQPYSGLNLCRQHFVADFEAKAKRAIRTHRWMESHDHIAVGLSGGPAGSALLFFLKGLTSERRDITLSAITVDEGISGYRDPSVAVKVADSLGVRCVVASFRDEYGTCMDDIAAEKGASDPCLYCRVLRRSLMNRIAREGGITKLALGSTLDDEAESVLVDMVRGDAESLLLRHRTIPGTVPWIHPFMYIPEPEVALYARIHLAHLGSGQERCPHARDTLREDIKTVLDDYTFRHPSAGYSLVRIGERLAEAGEMVATGIETCERCGEPCSGACGSCQILMEVRRSAA
jgi:uncharacterized protein (TIGR00269 family)